MRKQLIAASILLAGLLVLVGDEVLESLIGMSFPDGTEVALFSGYYFALLYAAEAAILSRSRPGGFGGFLKRMWQESAGLRMLLSIASGHLVVTIAATSMVALVGGGGQSQPFRFAPVISWPERILLLFGQIVPTATWRLAGLAGPLMAALSVLLVVLLWRQASLLSPRSSGSPYPGLVQELVTRGGEAFVADYWTAYPLAFLAEGRFAVAPADGTDRFPQVSARVRSEGPDAYLFVEGSAPLREFRAASKAGDAREEVVRPAAGGPRYHLFYVER